MLLLDRWLEGDEHAFEELYLYHQVWMYKMAYYKLSDPAIARDTVQDVLIKFYCQKDCLKNETSVKDYLFILLKNKILNTIRLEINQRKRETYWEERHSGNVATAHEAYSLKETEAQLAVAIGALPEKCKAVFLLKRNEDRSYREIAELLGISVNTVETHMKKALRILRDKLDYHLFILMVLGMGWW